jgi:copper chaperone CopZ
MPTDDVTAEETQHMSTPDVRTGEVELLIGGMTCASCAARVEKKLNRMDGVTATVNYATEKARVSFGGDVTTDDLIATVEKTGYTAALRPRPEARPEPARGEEDGVLPLQGAGTWHGSVRCWHPAGRGLATRPAHPPTLRG